MTAASVPFRYISAFLRASEAKFVRVVWCDSSNVIQAKAASVPRLQSVYKDGIGLCIGTQVSLCQKSTAGTPHVFNFSRP